MRANEFLPEHSDGSNISITGNEKSELQKKHNIQPGTDEWFKLWFSLPYLTGEKPVYEDRMLDPEVYGEMLPTSTVKRIVAGVMNQVDPGAKVSVKQSPEGYYIVRGEKLRFDFGITAAGGEISANIVNGYSSYKGAGVITQIISACFKAAEQLWGKPTKFVVSVQQDRGDGVWQAISKKLGAEWGGSVMENFADGKVKGKSRPGRVKRAGASCNGSVSDLRARAKRASGEKARMYHWCANMKSGKKK